MEDRPTIVMTFNEEASELAAIRHDLLNVLTALQHGCTLIGARLDRPEHAQLHALLDEMHKRIERGQTAVARLKDRSTGRTPESRSGAASRELGEQ